MSKIIPLTQVAICEQSPSASFLELFRTFNKVDAIEKAHSKKTIGKYNVFTENFKSFLRSIGTDDIAIEEIKIPLLRKFVLWLPKHLTSCSKTHLAKHINRINKVIDYAVTEGLLPFNSTASYKLKYDKIKEASSLDDDEFLTWVEHTWHSEIYQKAQDLFTFQMVTGLSYQDLFTYKTAVHDGKLWIEGTRGKTKRAYFVPLWHPDFSLALQIHNKHNGKLPFIELHFYNRLNREMACILGIETYITSHKGRKRCSIDKDENKGWSLAAGSALLGNTKKVYEAHYTRPAKKAIETQLAQAANYNL